MRCGGEPMPQWAPQTQAPPHPHPPLGLGAAPAPPEVVAKSEKRRRTRSLPHEGQARAVSTLAVIGRRSSNGVSQARHRYS